MIAAERDEMAERLGLRLDRCERALDIAVGDAEIADIGDVLRGRRGAGDRVVAIDSLRSMPRKLGRTAKVGVSVMLFI